MEPNDINPLYSDPAQQVSNTLRPNENTISISDPLSLDIPDDDLIDILNKRIKDSENFYEEKYNLKHRRRINETFLFGRQIGEKEKKGKLKDYETRSNDNALYEIEASLKPLAMSKLPDIIVTPGSPGPEREQSAKDLTTVVNDTNSKRNQREVVGLGFKHLPVYFTAIIKVFWNPEKGTDGDIDFCIVHPEYVIVDHTCTTRNPDDMGYIAQCTPMIVQEAVMKFPSKKEELYAALKKNGIMTEEAPTYKELASEFKMWEVHFSWYRKKGADKTELMNKEQMRGESLNEPGIKWEKIEGVMWKYDTVILDKMLDPNFDYEGEKKVFTYTNPGDETTKQEVDPQQLMVSALTGQQIPNMKTETIYHNYFDRPHKPYFFFGYDQWAKVYLDETSRIEQNIRNQENLDDQNKEIIDQIKTRVKHIWSTASGLDKSSIQRLDMDAPRMDVVVTGNPNEVHGAVVPERPDAAQFNALSDTRSRMYAISGSNAVRGQVQSQVATTNQIAREADFTRSDDLVEDTINAAYEWMSQWQMQFIKLRYTNEHLKEILGSKGEVTYIRLRRDTISDGMEVLIKASSTDKLKAQRNAMDTAKLGPPYSNPLDFFQDMDMSDPEGRAARGMMLSLDPQGYFTKYIMGLDSPAAAGAALNGQPQKGAPAQPAPNPSVPGGPQGPTPQNTSAVPTEQPAFPQGSPRAL